MTKRFSNKLLRRLTDQCASAFTELIDPRQQCRRAGAPVASTYPCGQYAKAALERIIGGSAVACEARDRDRYGRTIASCVAQNSDAAREMVRQGWAVAYTRFSLADVIDEGVARAANRALWAGTFDAPEEWRRHHKRDYAPDADPRRPLLQPFRPWVHHPLSIVRRTQGRSIQSRVRCSMNAVPAHD